MPRLRMFWIALLPLTLLSGCRKSAQNQSHEALVKEAIVSMRNTASALNGVTDAASAARAIEVLQRESQNLQSLRKRLADLGTATGLIRGRVKQHSQDMIAATQQMTQASATVVGKIQAGQFPPDLAQRLAKASMDYGQSMVDFSEQAVPLFE